MPLGLAALVNSTDSLSGSISTVAGPVPGEAALMVRVTVQNEPGSVSVTVHSAAREKAASLASSGQSTVKSNLSPALPPVTVLETVREPQVAMWSGTGAIRSFNWGSSEADDDRLLVKTPAKFSHLPRVKMPDSSRLITISPNSRLPLIDPSAWLRLRTVMSPHFVPSQVQTVILIASASRSPWNS